MPGAKSFMLCNMWDFIKYSKVQASSMIPIKMTHAWLMDYKFGDGIVDSFKPEEHGGCILIAFPGVCQLMISDPNMVQELYTTKNALVDKTEQLDVIMKDLLGNAFLFGKTDAAWKAKRKACAHAFYKNQLIIMMEVLKDKIEFYIDSWNKGIANSKEK